MGAPPFERDGVLKYPRSCTWTMGLKPSAAVAQRCTEASLYRSGVPDDKRVLPGVPLCTSMPLWGCIVDDAWILHDSSTMGIDGSAGWLPALDDEWERVGVQRHEGKSVNAGEGSEVQGMQVIDNSMGLKPD